MEIRAYLYVMLNQTSLKKSKNMPKTIFVEYLGSIFLTQFPILALYTKKIVFNNLFQFKNSTIDKILVDW